MITTLIEKPELKTEVIQLIEQSFEYEVGQNFETDFHLLINDKNHHNCYLILDEASKELIGHIGTKPRLFDIGSNEMKAIFIGGIAIKPKYRGMGIFRSAFHKLLNKLESDYEYAFLWSENSDIYRSFGFEEIETLEININNPENTEKKLKSIGFKKTKLHTISVEKLSEIKTLYNNEIHNKFISPSRNKHIWEEVINTHSIDLFIKENPSGSLLAYCLVGKGQDMNGFIHEYASKDKEVIDKIKQFSGLFYHDKKTENQIPVAFGKRLSNSNRVNQFLLEIKKKGLYIPGADSI